MRPLYHNWRRESLIWTCWQRTGWQRSFRACSSSPEPRLFDLARCLAELSLSSPLYSLGGNPSGPLPAAQSSLKHSMPNMTGRQGHRTMEMNVGSSAPYLTCTPCVPLFCTSFLGVETEALLDYQGRAGDHFHCAVGPSPGHIRCRNMTVHKQVRDPHLNPPAHRVNFRVNIMKLSHLVVFNFSSWWCHSLTPMLGRRRRSTI